MTLPTIPPSAQGRLNRLKHSLPALLGLLTVSEKGSINKAAEALHLSQPALTRSIFRLEQALGVPLLERSARGITLTRYGQVLVRHATAIEAEVRTAVIEIERLRHDEGANLRIGVTPLVLGHFLPSALKALRASQPQVSVHIVEGDRPTLLASLHRRDIDFLVSSIAPDMQQQGLEIQPLFTMELCVIASANHPLAARSNLRLQDLCEFQWVLPRADSSFYQRLEADFQRAGVEFPHSSIELSSPLVNKSIVRTSDLLAIVPLDAVADDLARGELVSLRGDWTFGTRTIAVLHREGVHPSPAGAALIAQIGRQVAAHEPLEKPP
jgi:LysR family pca operon transcriptional activator